MGERQYDWNSKISLAMSVSELGQIFSEPNAVSGGCGGCMRCSGSGVRVDPGGAPTCLIFQLLL